MDKYLGNKAKLLPLIETFVSSRISSASSISDLFAGTTNVSRYFSGRGYEVILGDLNRFSYVLGQAYLGQSTPPTFDRLPQFQCEVARVERLHVEFLRAFRKNADAYLPRTSEAQAWAPLRPLANVLSYLQAEGERNHEPWIITDYFSQWGTKADFRSLRGSTGKRNYFSQSNALFLDGIIRTIRDWWRRDLLTRPELFTLMASVIEEIVITANVSGTFHDFTRNRLWPNALQSFFLRVPLIRPNPKSVEITNDDALNATGYISQHDVCYLDPPYNFRQYSAYYHFLNFVAAVPMLENLDGYLAGIAQVRGQNPEDNQSSDFCSKASFVESLKELIKRVPSDHVVLSYYNGRNHWNHWSAVDEPTNEGLEKLSALFADKTLFSDYEAISALDVRRNYQSRIGERKLLVNEYLFLGRKRDRGESKTSVFVPLEANLRWGLADGFSHTRSDSQKIVQARRMDSLG